MLSLENVRAGTLQDGRLGSLLLPLGDYSAQFLVTAGGQDQLFGVFLSGQYRFHTVMLAEEGDNWAGFFVDDVRLEVDIDSASDAANLRPPIGSIVKRPNGTFLVALSGERRTMQRRVEMRLDAGGSGPAERVGVALSRWELVTGEGTDKTVLLSIEASDQA